MTMQLPYAEPLTVRELGERVVPEPPRRGEEGGEPCGLCAGHVDRGRLAGRALQPAPAGRRQPRRSGLAGEPRARRLVQRPVAGGGRRVRPAGRARRARDPRARRRRPRAPLPLGRRRRALPRVVHPAAARDARGVRDDASALGGRPAERHGRGARGRGQAHRRSAVTDRSSPAGSGRSTPSSSGSAR